MSESEKFQARPLPIKAWAEGDRPREKMLAKGRDALSDAELLAILIGSGVRNETAVDLGKRILDSVEGDWNRLGMLSLRELMRFKGIGQARAIAIAAALEIGRRHKNAHSMYKPQIKSSNDAFELLRPVLSDLDHEQFFVMYLNRGNKVIDLIKLSQGGVTGTVADAKLIFKGALERLAVSIIVAHNHPSGTLRPSDADIKLTRNLQEGAKLLDMSLADHIIVAERSYYSFADEGLL